MPAATAVAQRGAAAVRLPPFAHRVGVLTGSRVVSALGRRCREVNPFRELDLQGKIALFPVDPVGSPGPAMPCPALHVPHLCGRERISGAERELRNEVGRRREGVG